MAKQNSDPTFQSYLAVSVGLGEKSAFAQPINYSGRWAVNAAERNIVQRTQIAPVQITLYPRACQ